MKARIEIALKTCRLSLYEDRPGERPVADSSCKPLEEALSQLLASVRSREVEEVVLDFCNQDFVSNLSLRTITLAAIALRKTGQKPQAIKMTPRLRAMFNEQGLADLFVFPDDKPKVRGKTQSTRPILNAEFMNPFVEGTISTLKIQCSTPVEPIKPALGKTYKPDYSLDVMALIGLVNRNFHGSVALCFPKQTFLSVMSRMLGEEYKEFTSELQDGAGELLNIIFGIAKVKLNKADHRIEKAIPSVIIGKEISLRHLTSEVSIVFPFSSELGPFHIEIGMEPQAEGGESES